MRERATDRASALSRRCCRHDRVNVTSAEHNRCERTGEEGMIKIVDDFCPSIDEVRASALASGFGTWKPNKGEVGSSNYEGMNFWGRPSLLLHALAHYIGRPVYPNAMFFRV